MIKFTIYGDPVPKGRPKFTVRGGYAMAYTPKKTKENEDYIRCAALPYKPYIKPFTGPVSLTAIFYRSIPKSFPKKKAEMAKNGILRPTTTPDLDNYLKQVEDALSGIFYENDKQIVDSSESKYYSERPRIEIEIQEVIENV